MSHIEPTAYIEPQTDAELVISVALDDVLRDDAAVTAQVIGPTGTLITVAPVSMTLVAAGTGQYALAWDKDWTTDSGKPVRGEYLVIVKSVVDSLERVRHFRVPVRFSDDT